jgi:serine protease inhibitor
LDTIVVLSEIVIDKSITIDGQGVAIVSGGNQTRIFRVQNDARDITVTLKNMGIVDATNSADEFGGAVYNNAQTLTVDTILFDGNANSTENGKGGAVYNSGTLMSTTACLPTTVLLKMMIFILRTGILIL